MHGQFYDLLEIFDKSGDPRDNKYIFMGDMVDRGFHSVETFTYLMCLKIQYPGNITLLRGNHESAMTSRSYGLYDEIMQKYGNVNPWKYFLDVFNHLGLAALIEGKILCLHGGLSPDIKTIDQIRTLDRFMEIPSDGPFADLMWSDPEDISTWAMSPRGAGWLFGAKVTSEFNRINGLSLICRAHQLAMEGFKIWFPEENLTTIWSAPNYCYRCGNMASVLQIDSDLSQNYMLFDEAKTKEKLTNYKKVVPYFL